MSEFTRAEVCAVAIAEAFRGDGEILVSPIGTLPMIGARLAKLTFAPDILLTDGIASLIANVLPIGGVSETSYSAILAYDREKFNARLSWFWRDDFYNNNEARLFANPLQVWRLAEESLDFQFTWLVNDNWTVTFDATNLTEPTFHWNYGDQPELFNFHNYLYSRTFAVGVRYGFGR